MPETDERLKEISDKISAHITAVKGTLELLDASVSEEDLRSLILKAVERMDRMQALSNCLCNGLVLPSTFQLQQSFCLSMLLLCSLLL